MRAFKHEATVLRAVFSALIVAVSWPALFQGHAGLIAGGAEIAGAALFMFDAMRGGIVLLFVFAAAFALHASSGEFPLQLPIYAVATAALMALTRTRPQLSAR